MAITIPSYVAPNELIQSAWGNGVVDALIDLDALLINLTAYTPTVGGTGWALGAGSSQGYWVKSNGVTQVWVFVQFGAGATFGAAAALTLSLPAAATVGGSMAGFTASVAAITYPIVMGVAGSAMTAQVTNATGGAGTPVRLNNTTSTAPGTWASGSVVTGTGSYI